MTGVPNLSERGGGCLLLTEMPRRCFLGYPKAQRECFDSRNFGSWLTEEYFLGVDRHEVAHLPFALPQVVVHLRSSQKTRRSLFVPAGRVHGITDANSGKWGRGLVRARTGTAASWFENG